MRICWPRVFGVMQGFEKLTPLHNFISYYMGVPTGFILDSSAGRGDAKAENVKAMFDVTREYGTGL